MHKSIESILSLARENVSQNPGMQGKSGADAAVKYLNGLLDEVQEVTDELKPDNAVYLQDELSDIMWDYSVLLALCEAHGWIDSVDEVFAQGVRKYTERAPAFLEYNNDKWNAIKLKQKADLAQEHSKRYQGEKE